MLPSRVVLELLRQQQNTGLFRPERAQELPDRTFIPVPYTRAATQKVLTHVRLVHCVYNVRGIALRAVLLREPKVDLTKCTCLVVVILFERGGAEERQVLEDGQ